MRRCWRASTGSVLVLTKGRIDDCNTRWARGGSRRRSGRGFGGTAPAGHDRGRGGSGRRGGGASADVGRGGADRGPRAAGSAVRYSAWRDSAGARGAHSAALACGRSGDDVGLPLHLGLHAGDVIREDNNVYGGAVNIAARISGLSAPGEVLVSETVRLLARTSAGVRFEHRGRRKLKGVAEPSRLWAVCAE